jgi:stage II sporulation protein D
MIELSHSTGTEANRLHVVNIIEIEDYVPGVVANESIASFHMEALKAQATAARGYAIANIGRFRATFPYDIVDSTTSQVYRGVISEHPRAVQASAETVGIVASYNGQIIGALYSSSFGGHSDSNHWIFNSPASQLPGTNIVPYLVGIYDGVPPILDLSDPATHDIFWRTIQPQGYDMCGRVNNRFSRWRIDIPAASIKSRLTTTNSVLISGTRTGPVTGVAVTLRMPGSERVAIARITLSTGVVDVRGWDNLRNVLGRSVVSTPSSCPPPNATAIAANFTLTNPSILEPYNNPDGTFGGVIAHGGGWGHNTGMSQYGGHGRALAGQTFTEILKAYYTGVDIGSYPIDIGREPGSGPPTLRQQFYAPSAMGSLVVRSDGLKKLVVHINETYDLVLNADELAAGTVTVDISAYLVPGLNTVQYNPVGRNGTATVQVVIE